MKAHLRVSYVWRDEVMADEVFLEPGSCTLGSTKGATFVTPDLGLPSGFEIIRPGARGYLLTLGSGMSGRLRLGGEEFDVADFLRRGGGGAEGAQGSFRATGLEPGDWGVIHLDGERDNTLCFQFPRADAPVPKSGLRDADLLLPGFAFAMILHLVLLLIVFHFKSDRPGFVFPGKRELVAGYLINRPPPPEPPAPPEAVRAGEADSKEKEPPKSTQGAEGKAGGEGEKERQRAPDPDKGEPDQTIPEAVQVGLLSRQSRDDIKKTLDRGGFDEKLGKALARMQGPLNDGTMGGSGKGRGTGYGPGEGTGTSTRGGNGPGGGGTAIGDVQTSRPVDTGGERAARGLPGGKGVKEVGVKVDTGSPGGDLGGRSAAEILKVVSSRKNGVRTCYERELQRTKDLGGKVVISWRITEDGRVLDARVSKSSMGNGRVEDCLVRQVSSLKFAASPGSGVAKVNFPFLFAPR